MRRSVALFAVVLFACGGRVALDPEEGIEMGGLSGTTGSGAAAAGGAMGGSGAEASGGVGAWAGGSGGWTGTGALGGGPAGGGGGLDPIAAVCDGVWQLPCSGYPSLGECMTEMRAAEEIALSLGCEDGWSPFMICAGDYPGSCYGVEYVPDPRCAEQYDVLFGCLDPALPANCVLTGVESSNCAADCDSFGASCRLFDTLGTVQCTCSYGPNTNLFFFLDSCQELAAAVLTQCA